MTTTNTNERLTWQPLVAAEPELGELLEEIRSTKREIWATREGGEIRFRVYGSVRVLHDVIKPVVTRLFGEGRGRSRQETREACDLAIRTLWGALPRDFEPYEVDAARERAYAAELDEGEWIAVAGPAAARRKRGRR